MRYSCFQWNNLSEKEICGELIDSNGKSVSMSCRKNQGDPNSRSGDYDDFEATFSSLESNSKDCRNFYEAESELSFRYNCIQSERPSKNEVCRTLVDELTHEPVWTMCLREKKTQNSSEVSSTGELVEFSLILGEYQRLLFSHRNTAINIQIQLGILQ